jgi:PAS domain S-box-containing protein
VTRPGEWSTLFSAAFTQSRNAMVLVDSERRLVDANGAYLKLLGYGKEDLIGRPMYEFVVGGPALSPAQWQRTLESGRFSGETRLYRAGGGEVAVQWAATVEVITGRRLALVVALSTSRWGRSFRRAIELLEGPSPLTEREREIVRLMALGSTGPEIADELRISHDTVRTHARNAMTKVGARSRAHLVAKALGEGLIWEAGNDCERR